MDWSNVEKWRAEQKAKRRAWVAERRAQLAVDERVQAVKENLRAKAKAHRKQVAAERKQRKREGAETDGAVRDREMLKLVRSASE